MRITLISLTKFCPAPCPTAWYAVGVQYYVSFSKEYLSLTSQGETREQVFGVIGREGKGAVAQPRNL